VELVVGQPVRQVRLDLDEEVADVEREAGETLAALGYALS